MNGLKVAMAITDTAILSEHKNERLKTDEKAKASRVKGLTIIGPDHAVATVVEKQATLTASTCLAKDISNTRANEMGCEAMEELSTAVGNKHGMEVKVEKSLILTLNEPVCKDVKPECKVISMAFVRLKLSCHIRWYLTTRCSSWEWALRRQLGGALTITITVILSLTLSPYGWQEWT